MSFLTDVVERLRALIFRAREERELAEELRHHLEEDTALCSCKSATSSSRRIAAPVT